ncbi:hypothetical protein [Nonomuraea rubra]|uniref:Uncharacterized protein n=1 Tax=Nonomuraea rubra TaxID=46180 RepID=A0A7X0NWH6_9ACTN|nr:hypothetical protein [Nonomuraea rubra]MBB6550908.1 hypothetical protein [Nonomuraea rubra]
MEALLMGVTGGECSAEVVASSRTAGDVDEYNRQAAAPELSEQLTVALEDFRDRPFSRSIGVRKSSR